MGFKKHISTECPVSSCMAGSSFISGKLPVLCEKLILFVFPYNTEVYAAMAGLEPESRHVSRFPVVVKARFS